MKSAETQLAAAEKKLAAAEKKLDAAKKKLEAANLNDNKMAAAAAQEELKYASMELELGIARLTTANKGLATAQGMVTFFSEQLQKVYICARKDQNPRKITYYPTPCKKIGDAWQDKIPEHPKIPVYQALLDLHEAEKLPWDDSNFPSILKYTLLLLLLLLLLLVCRLLNGCRHLILSCFMSHTHYRMM